MKLNEVSINVVSGENPDWGNQGFCSTSAWKFKTAGPVESYFREHLGLDWPYGGSQPISTQRGQGRKVLFSSFREPFSVTTASGPDSLSDCHPSI